MMVQACAAWFGWRGKGGGAIDMTDGPRPQVAVVDDDTGVRDSLRFLLETAGYRVATYESAPAYLQDRASCRAACLVLDQHMRQLTGLEMLALLDHQGIRLPTVLITGSPSPDLPRRAEALGVVAVLEKPLADDALLSFVERAVSGGRAR
jgi:two-component system, LuxR family, response regulator FixJ